MMSNHLFSVYFLQNFEDFNEQIDDVQIELDGGQDVFLCTESGHDHLGIVDDEEGEEESSSHCHGGVSQLIAEEYLEESSKDENHQAGGEDSAHVGEVSLSLECKCCEAKDHCSSEEEGLDDDTLIKEGNQNSDSVSLNHGEASQEDQVDGSFLPLDVESDEETDGQEKCRKQESWPSLDKLLHSRSEKEHSSYQGSHAQLD